MGVPIPPFISYSNPSCVPVYFLTLSYHFQQSCSSLGKERLIHIFQTFIIGFKAGKAIQVLQTLSQASKFQLIHVWSFFSPTCFPVKKAGWGLLCGSSGTYLFCLFNQYGTHLYQRCWGVLLCVLLNKYIFQVVYSLVSHTQSKTFSYWFLWNLVNLIGKLSAKKQMKSFMDILWTYWNDS